MADSQFNELAILTARSKIQLVRGDSKAAMTLAEEALSHVADDAFELELRSLAIQLQNLERYADALTIWLRIYKSVGVSPDVRSLVFCAEQVKRYDIILDVTSSVRETGNPDTHILYKEIETVQAFDLEQAITLLHGMISDKPNDKYAPRNLSYMGLRWLRHDLIDPSLELYPPVNEVTPVQGHFIVNILRQYGDPNEALHYAYELVRQHPEDPIANRLYTSIFYLPDTPDPVISEPTEVAPGVAVRFTEKGKSSRWIILDDSPNPRQVFDEYPTSSSLGQAFIRKRVGDTVVISRGPGRDRIAIVDEVISKYAYLYRNILENWQIKFNEHNYIHSFNLMTKDLDSEQLVPDLTDLELVAEKRFQQTSSAESTYNGYLITVDQFARLANRAPFLAFLHLVSSPDLFVNSSQGLESEQTAALKSLKECHSLVLDITALATLFVLNLGDVLRTWPGTLVISQHTALELRRTKQQYAQNLRKHSYFGKNKDGYVLQEVPADYSKTQYDAFMAFTEIVWTKCEVRGAIALAAMDPHKRDELDETLSRHGLESIQLASQPGHVLWTEDVALAVIAGSEFACHRTWTQCVLLHAVATKLISEDDCFSASAKLLGHGFRGTRFNMYVFAKAGSMAEWDFDRWPFTRALEELSKCVDDLVFLNSVALLLKELYAHSKSPMMQAANIASLLGRFSESIRNMDRLERLPTLLSRAFGSDVMIAREIKVIVRAWLAEAKRRPRLELL
jgi:tetratricopeptide (TPR) repeat protein